MVYYSEVESACHIIVGIKKIKATTVYEFKKPITISEYIAIYQYLLCAYTHIVTLIRAFPWNYVHFANIHLFVCRYFE